MGGSKPPTSKAQKARARLLKKIPGNKAKMFKKVNAKRQEENALWKTNSNEIGTFEKSTDTGPDKHNVINSSSSNISGPVIKLVRIAVIPKKKGESNRQARARLRELVLADQRVRIALHW